MRTTDTEYGWMHLANSLKIFKMLEEKVARYDYSFEKQCIEARNYEALEMYVMELLMTG